MHLITLSKGKAFASRHLSLRRLVFVSYLNLLTGVRGGVDRGSGSGGAVCRCDRHVVLAARLGVNTIGEKETTEGQCGPQRDGEQHGKVLEDCKKEFVS